MNISLSDELSLKVMDGAKKRQMTPAAFVVEAVQNHFAELKQRERRLQSPLEHIYTERVHDTTMEDAI